MSIADLWPSLRPIVADQVGHLVATAGGALIGVGAIQSSDQVHFVQIGTGLIMWAIPQAWSWWNNIGRNRVLAAMAKMKPVAPASASTAEAVKAAVEATTEPKKVAA
jgi:hypothetical protein